MNKYDLTFVKIDECETCKGNWLELIHHDKKKVIEILKLTKKPVLERFIKVYLSS